jgi:membrane fusion protein, heavy metal efflux system
MSSIVHPQRIAPPQSGEALPKRDKLPLWRRFIPIGSTVVIVALIGALAFWGHSHDWKLPSFASLTKSSAKPVDDWCTEHNVPESQCIECNPELLAKPRDYGWCKIHGVAQCPLEHPDVAQLKETPVISTEDIDRANRALATRPRTENNSLCTLHQKRIQFASADAVEKAGVGIAVVQVRPVREAITANGEVVYDQTRRANFSSRVSGTVWRVEKEVGDRVAAGDLLALVDAVEIGQAKSELLQALAQYRLKESTWTRLQNLGANGVVPGRQLHEAEAEADASQIRVQAARQALINLGLPVQLEDFAAITTEEIARRIQFLGLPESLASTLDPNTTTSNLFPLRSSLDGVVISRQAVAGEVVGPEQSLFGVADVEHLWLMLNVRQEDAKYLSLGQPVDFEPSDSPSAAPIHGTLDWISTEADDATRTVSVRVELPNKDGSLRANTFGIGRIVLREEAAARVVPTEAIHWDGMCQVVFVRDKNYFQADSPKFFHVRPVRTGVSENGTTEVIVGLLPGEIVASANSVVLESQLLKSNLGAGCDCVQ